ncbi:MAG: class I SAM-dependent methyltransferase [Candidatus Bathyarchaeia archaeon]
MPDVFSWLAPLYDRIFTAPDRRALSWLDVREGQLILDVGGGTGRVSKVLLKDGVKAVVVDLSPGMLIQARKKGLLVCCARVEALPFASEVVDAVIVVDAFHHFKDHATASKELIRVLKRGGRLFLEEPDITNLVVKLIALGEKLLCMRSRFYDLAALTSFFSAQGGNLIWFQRKKGFMRLIISRP